MVGCILQWKAQTVAGPKRLAEHVATTHLQIKVPGVLTSLEMFLWLVPSHNLQQPVSPKKSSKSAIKNGVKQEKAVPHKRSLTSTTGK